MRLKYPLVRTVKYRLIFADMALTYRCANQYLTDANQYTLKNKIYSTGSVSVIS